MDKQDQAPLELASLPLADGRQVAVPLLALAEVQQLNLDPEDGAELGVLHWRGLDLPIRSLDAFCGLEPAAPEQHTTVAVVRGARDADEPFQALAFCGLASHLSVTAEQLESADSPEEGKFTASARLGGEHYLVPDLATLGYAGETRH